jgi:Zn-dependent protease
MNFSIPDVIREVLLMAPIFIISLTFHEYAHAWAAYKLGDSTARYMGRLTMDPMAHISWFGTVIFPALSLLSGAPILFGWANPVPIDMRNFKKPRAHMAIAAAAGPASNILLAILATALLSFVVHNTGIPLGPRGSIPGSAGAAADMLRGMILLNLALAFFNLIPIPPLDGSRLVQGIVSRETADKMDQWAQYGFMLMLILWMTGALKVIGLPIWISVEILFRIFGLS